MSRLVVLSNRAPSIDGKGDAGGLVVALRDALAREDGLWIGANPEPVDEPRPALVHHRRPDFDVALFDLTPEDHEGYYLGYSNSVLWPVFHGRVDLADFRASHFDAYCATLRRIAELVGAELRPGDKIWVHDYHLIPLAAELRRLGHENVIGFFLHIPVPAAETFLAIPEYETVADWLTRFDLVGLQTRRDVSHFIDLQRRINGCEVLADGRLSCNGRRFEVASHPISIDAAEFAVMAERSDARAPEMARIIGVDRLDYSKGLPQRFRGYRRFLENRPEMHGKVYLTQIAPPTREDVEAYQQIRDELEGLAGSINGAFGDIDWVPILYIHRTVPRDVLAGLFRCSRVCLVTPLADGMNLVAKEYVAAQDRKDPGVLVLSQFAGAAEEMDEALIVNPHSEEEIADAIATALDMPLEERIRRNEALVKRLMRHDVARWASLYLGRLDALERARAALTAPPGDAGALAATGPM